MNITPLFPDAAEQFGPGQSLNSGSLFRDCPDCGYPMEMAYSFLCQDSAIRQYIYLCREGPDESGGFHDAAMQAKKLAQGSTSDAILWVDLEYAAAALRGEKVR